MKAKFRQILSLWYIRSITAVVVFSLMISSAWIFSPSTRAIGTTFPVIDQRSYIWENDDGTGVDTNTQLAAGNASLTGVPIGERITLRQQIRNTGDANLNTANLGLFYDRNDGIFTKVGTNSKFINEAGVSCADISNWTCTEVDDPTLNITGESSMAIDQNGSPWIAYVVDESAANGDDIYVARYVGTNGSGCISTVSAAWSCSIVASHASKDLIGPSMAIAPDGRPAFAYMEDTADRTLKYANYIGSLGNCFSGAWSCTTIESAGSTDFGRGASLTFSPTGVATISYYKETGAELKIAENTGGSTCAGSTWTCTSVDVNGAFTEETSIAFGPGSIPWISYFNTTNNSLKVARRVTSATCTSGAWTCETVHDDATYHAGKESSIGFAPDGKAWVAYYFGDDGTCTITVECNLNVAVNVGGAGGSGCTDTDWSCTVVDNLTDAGNTGREPSIAFNPAGSAWVTYKDITNADIMLARYVGSGGSGCNGSPTEWSCEAIQTTDNTGNNSSVAFDSRGTAWISYFNDTGTNKSVMTAKLLRGGEVLMAQGTAGANNDTITESHTDMTAVPNDVNRDDADCAAGTWVNGRWFEIEEGVVNLANAASPYNCTEVAFTIDTSQMVSGRTYRFVLATNDNWHPDKGLWRGPGTIQQYPTLTVQTAANSMSMRASKDNSPRFANCTNIQWSCGTAVGDATTDVQDSKIAVDSEGNPWLSYRDGNGNNLWVAKYDGDNTLSGCTNNNAWTCTKIHDTGSVGIGNDIAIGPDDRAWISHVDTANNQLEVAYYVGSGGDCDVVAPGPAGSDAWNCETIDLETTIGVYTAIAIDPSGRPWVAYKSNDDGGKLKIAHRVGGGDGNCTDTDWFCQEVNNPIVPNNNVGNFPDIAIDADGNPWISHIDTTDGELQVAQYVGHNNGICADLDSDWDCWTADNSPTTMESTSIAFDNTGKAWISYYDSGTTNFRVVNYVGAGGNCSDVAWSCTTVVSAGNTDPQSIAFDSSGAAWVAYKDNLATDELRFARYVGSGGTGCAVTDWDCSLLANTGNIGSNGPHMAFDSSGVPWVSYREDEGTNDNLRIVKANISMSKPTAVSSQNWPGKSARWSDGRYHLTRGTSPVSDVRGVCASVDYAGYCGITDNDGYYDSSGSVPSTQNQTPLMIYSKKFAGNTILPTAEWIGKTNLAPSTAGSTGDLKLQIYRFGTTNAWEDVATDTGSTDCSTNNCRLSGIPSGTPSQYFELINGSEYWVHFRLYQESSNSSTPLLKTDAFIVTRTQQLLRGGKFFQDGLKREYQF